MWCNAEQGALSGALTQACVERYDSSKDAHFLLPAIPGMQRPAVLQVHLHICTSALRTGKGEKRKHPQENAISQDSHVEKDKTWRALQTERRSKQWQDKSGWACQEKTTLTPHKPHHLDLRSNEIHHELGSVYQYQKLLVSTCAGTGIGALNGPHELALLASCAKPVASLLDTLVQTSTGHVSNIILTNQCHNTNADISSVLLFGLCFADPTAVLAEGTKLSPALNVIKYKML